MKRTHGADHWDPDGCFGCKVRTVDISAEAMPSRHPMEARAAQTERRWAKDHAAYRRLVREGHDPGHVDGAARVEQEAKTAADVATMDRRPSAGDWADYR